MRGESGGLVEFTTSCTIILSVASTKCEEGTRAPRPSYCNIVDNVLSGATFGEHKWCRSRRHKPKPWLLQGIRIVN